MIWWNEPPNSHFTYSFMTRSNKEQVNLRCSALQIATILPTTSLWLVVCTHPSETYEFISWDDSSQLNGTKKHQNIFQTTNQSLPWRRPGSEKKQGLVSGSANCQRWPASCAATGLNARMTRLGQQLHVINWKITFNSWLNRRTQWSMFQFANCKRETINTELTHKLKCDCVWAYCCARLPWIWLIES